MVDKNDERVSMQHYTRYLKTRLRCALLWLHVIPLAFALVITLINAVHVNAAKDVNYTSLLSLISSPLPEYGLVISPNGNTAVFTRMSGAWGSKNNQSTLYVTHKVLSEWTTPEPLFGKVFQTSDAFFSPDGRTLFFTSNQGLSGTAKTDDDIWQVSYQNGSFIDPKPLRGINSDTVESSPVVTANGNIYFSSRRSGGMGAGDIWISRFANGTYQPPQNLGAPVNMTTSEWNLFVDKDEQYLIVEASGRKGAKSASGDLYLYKKNAGNWGDATPLSHINTTGSDLMPRITNDEQGFFYTSSGSSSSRDTEIYYKSASDFLFQTTEALKRVLVVVSRSNHEIVALDPYTLEVVARYPTGKGPHEVATSSNGKIIYTPAYGVYPKPHIEPILPSQMQFTSEASETLNRISLASDNPQNSEFPICQRSHGIVLSPDEHLWVTCQNESRVMELNEKTGALIKNWPLGVPGSHILVATPDNNYIITSNVSAGSISILNRLSGTVKTVQTGAGAEGLALEPNSENVWVGNTQENTISVVRVDNGTIINEFPSHGRFPVKMTVTEGASEVWVVNTFSRGISILDLGSGDLKDKISFNSPPLGIHSSSDGETIYVTFPRLNEVRAFNRRTRKEMARTDQVMEGDGMAWAIIPH
ncbi:beta-propeller fold lactonase family protein [Kordiimonas aquimaris]|uniref:hypothetical protein n=1 Tax=Kordiimonas aquimaris TaxID=707591 RepID=UPI0021D2BB39|nr:hypothetical protein [Kordiimonas aquimaris]